MTISKRLRTLVAVDNQKRSSRPVKLTLYFLSRLLLNQIKAPGKALSHDARAVGVCSLNQL